MYVVTYKNEPATLKKLYKLNDYDLSPYSENNQLYLAARTKKALLDLYIFHFGFCWRERPKNVECQRVLILSAARPPRRSKESRYANR